MLLAEWRVASPSFDVDAFLRKFPELQPDVVWHVGDKKLRGRVCETSGFNAHLGEAETVEELLAKTRESLEHWRSVLLELHGMHVASEVDFGMTVGTRRFFTRSIRLEPEQLHWFYERGLAVVVSAYPAAEEDEDG